MAPTFRRSRRAAVDFSGAQAADVTTGDSAGENIYHGLDGDDLRAILQQQTEFYTTLVSAYERQYKDVTGQLDLLRREFDIYQKGEKAQRVARQQTLDGALASLRWWLAGLTIALLFAVAVIGYLLYRDQAALAARALYDSALSLGRPSP